MNRVIRVKDLLAHIRMLEAMWSDMDTDTLGLLEDQTVYMDWTGISNRGIGAAKDLYYDPCFGLVFVPLLPEDLEKTG